MRALGDTVRGRDGADAQFSILALCWFDTSRESYHLELAQLNREAGIGEKLRLAREARGIPLRDISEQTRISMRYLTAIETDDYKRLPGGIFNRSFIRAYAKHIGYDEEEAVTEYASTVRDQTDSPDDVSTTPFKSLVYTEGSHPNRSALWTLFWAILILVALALSVLAGLHFYQRRFASKTQSSGLKQTSEHFSRSRDARGGHNEFNV